MVPITHNFKIHTILNSILPNIVDTDLEGGGCVV